MYVKLATRFTINFFEEFSDELLTSFFLQLSVRPHTVYKLICGAQI